MTHDAKIMRTYRFTLAELENMLGLRGLIQVVFVDPTDRTIVEVITRESLDSNG